MINKKEFIKISANYIKAKTEIENFQHEIIKHFKKIIKMLAKELNWGNVYDLEIYEDLLYLNDLDDCIEYLCTSNIDMDIGILEPYFEDCELYTQIPIRFLFMEIKDIQKEIKEFYKDVKREKLQIVKENKEIEKNKVKIKKNIINKLTFEERKFINIYFGEL